MADILNEYGIPYQLGLEQFDSTPAYLAERAYMAGSVASIYLVKGLIRHGTAFQDSKLVVFGSEDLFETSELVARASASKSALATFSADLIDLKPGDYVVHAEHGVAQYLGLREIAQGEAQGDYMLLEYAGGAKLYVPADPHGPGPALPRRGRSQAGARPHGRRHLDAHQDAHQSQNARHGGRAAQALRRPQNGRGLSLSRRIATGSANSKTPSSSPRRATRSPPSSEIKRDMESPQPMDRLLCGDVGFGKTEVVMRAAFKALGDGKQVAVLAPTTVLAFQHFETFKRRFQPFPVRIEMFSRFRTPKEIKASLADLAEGKVDIAIGTHRLLVAGRGIPRSGPGDRG